jgi:DNA-binding HxlR family transcriptional regulator
MTARNERAVRDAPGGAPDRRGTGCEQKVAVGEPRSASGLSSSTSLGLHPSQRDFVEFEMSGPERSATTDPPLFGRRPTLPLLAEVPRAADFETPRVPFRSPRLAARQSNIFATEDDGYSPIYELEHPGTIEILLLLDRERRTNASRLRHQLRPGPKALARALQALTKARVVRSGVCESFPFARIYELTDRGEKLAETIRSWPSILTD